MYTGYELKKVNDRVAKPVGSSISLPAVVVTT